MSDKKFFRLDMSIAVEAYDAEEAFEILVTDETMVQIKKLIIDSKDSITEIFMEKDNNPTIIN